MRRLRQMLLAAVFVTIFVHPGLGCSHEGSSAVFTQSFGPDQPYSAYARGRLGVIGRSYRIRNLVIAFNTLSGRALTPAEQKAAIDVDRYYNPGGYVKPGDDVGADPAQLQEQHQGSGIADWVALVSSSPTNFEHQVPGQDYESFTNCLDDAFTHAAARLTALRSKYGATDQANIQNWIDGQEAVFSNCGDGSSNQFQYPKPPPPPPGHVPAPVAANAPLWLRQERAYQIAAAQFYALDYDSALAGFRSIAADKASPLAPLARYVVARVLIRKASLHGTQLPPNLSQDAMRQAMEANNQAILADYAAARDQLQAILRDPAMKSLYPQTRHLLDFVMLRVDPEAQAEELARRLTAPAMPGEDYEQTVIDLGYAYTSLPTPASSLVIGQGKTPVAPRSPLLRWMDAMYGATNGNSESIGLNFSYQHARTDQQRLADAIASWRTTHGFEWLVAALTLAQPGDDAVAELTAAAKAVSPTSPAYASVTYHRLRLASSKNQPEPATYTEVAALLPQIERTQSRSTINLFLDTQASLAPTLSDFLKSSTRLPASYTDVDGFEDGSSAPDYPINPGVALCGVNVYATKTPHFDTAIATIFNQRMPLHTLRDAVLGSDLPPNLRFQLAHMAWTRALLLDDADTARSLGPYLAGCQPAFKTWLDQYTAAKSSDERHVLGLLAMMRFTSTEPLVRTGGERDFAAYDEYRDNWWCNADTSGQSYPPQPKPVLLFSQPLVTAAAQPDPPFLTDADQAAAAREIAALEKVPGASDYFARQALDWVNAHPADPHNADLLGYAMRVVRNACRSDATKELNHQLFGTVHRRYPKSEWAARYTTWE